MDPLPSAGELRAEAIRDRESDESMDDSCRELIRQYAQRVSGMAVALPRPLGPRALDYDDGYDMTPGVGADGNLLWVVRGGHGKWPWTRNANRTGVPHPQILLSVSAVSFATPQQGLDAARAYLARDLRVLADRGPW